MATHTPAIATAAKAARRAGPGRWPRRFTVASLGPGGRGLGNIAFGVTEIPYQWAMVNDMEESGWIERQPHPQDGRAMGLHPTPQGQAMMKNAEATATQLELEISSGLSEDERKTLLGLLKKVYK